MTEAPRASAMPVSRSTRTDGAAPVYAAYMALQAVGGVVLWVLIGVSPFVRTGFDLVVARPEVTDSFLLPDLVVIVTSALSAWAIWTVRPWAVPMVAFTLGGVVYPTAYLVSWVTSADGTGWVALAVMLAVSTLSGWVLAGVWWQERAEASPSAAPPNA